MERAGNCRGYKFWRFAFRSQISCCSSRRAGLCLEQRLPHIVSTRTIQKSPVTNERVPSLTSFVLCAPAHSKPMDCIHRSILTLFRLSYVQLFYPVAKRGYAEQFSRAKPHMNIGTIGMSTLYFRLSPRNSISPQVTSIMVKRH